MKPENIIIRGRDAILIGFDAARLHKPEAENDTQVLGLSQSDARTDIYSLWCW